MLVEHGADAPVRRADHHRVAHFQRAVLDEQRRHRAARLVHLAFDHRADGVSVGIGFDLDAIGHEQDCFQQVVNVLFFLGRNGDAQHVAAVLVNHQAVIGQLFFDSLGVGVGLVNLVERDDDGDTRGFGMGHGL